MTHAHTAEMLDAKGRNRGNGSANAHRTRKSKFISETCAKYINIFMYREEEELEIKCTPFL